MATVKVRVVARVTYEREYSAPDKEANDLIRMAKNGRWKQIGEMFADGEPDDCEIDGDDVILVVNGKEVFDA